jgi:hypothetical protein
MLDEARYACPPLTSAVESPLHNLVKGQCLLSFLYARCSPYGCIHFVRFLQYC